MRPWRKTGGLWLSFVFSKTLMNHFRRLWSKVALECYPRIGLHPGSSTPPTMATIAGSPHGEECYTLTKTQMTAPGLRRKGGTSAGLRVAWSISLLRWRLLWLSLGKAKSLYLATLKAQRPRCMVWPRCKIGMLSVWTEQSWWAFVSSPFLLIPMKAVSKTTLNGKSQVSKFSIGRVIHLKLVRRLEKGLHQRRRSYITRR